MMKTALALVLAALLAVPIWLSQGAEPVLAQARLGLSPEQAQELRGELDRANRGFTVAIRERDRARGAAVSAESRAVAAQANLVRVAEIFRLPFGTPEDRIIEVLASWYEQDQDNRARLAELSEIVGRIEAGEIRSRADYHLQVAQAAFDDGRLEDADAALAELAFLRRSGQEEARLAWSDAVGARSALADQRRDHETARRLLRESRSEERTLSNYIQWMWLIGEARSYIIEDQSTPENELLISAISLLREEGLALADRNLEPDAWASTQVYIANILLELGARNHDAELTQQAIAAYEAALEERRLDVNPSLWSMTTSNIGAAYLSLGQMGMGDQYLERAIEIFEEIIEAIDRDEYFAQWAAIQINIGNANAQLGQNRRNSTYFEAAIEAYDLSLTVYGEHSSADTWATIHNNKGNVYRFMGQYNGNDDYIVESIRMYNLALQYRTRDRDPLGWAYTQSNIGVALIELSEISGDYEYLERAAAAYEQSLLVLNADIAPSQWAESQFNYILVLARLGERRGDFSQVLLLRSRIIDIMQVAQDHQMNEMFSRSGQLLATLDYLTGADVQ